MRHRIAAVVAVGAGGATGAITRHALAGLSGALPWGTLAANVAGAALLGIVLTERHLADHVSARVRLLVATGFCSSLSTYSTFALETTRLADGVAIAGATLPGPTAAVAYVALTYALGMGAIVLTQALTRGALR